MREKTINMPDCSMELPTTETDADMQIRGKRKRDIKHGENKDRRTIK